MVSKIITVRNPMGLHLRPVGKVCEKALEYSCKVQMMIDENQYNLKSVISVLSAGVRMPGEIRLVCDGEREEQALEELSTMLEKCFE